MIQFLFQGGEQLILRKLFYDLAMLDQQTFSDTARDSQIRFFCFSGAVYHAAHDSHFDIQRVILYHFLHFGGQIDQIDLGSSTGGTGYDLNAALAQS